MLGICYGQHLMAHLLGGTVQLGVKGEYGLATFDLLANGGGSTSALFDGISGPQQIWMSHRDLVSAVPPGFSVLGSTPTCAMAAIEAPARGLYGVQPRNPVQLPVRYLRLPARLGSAPSRAPDRR